MGTYLKYISRDDEEQLLDKATRSAYTPGSLILKEGEQRHALFLIREGAVRIELDHPEFNIEITRLSAGEIFGEMSFLDEFTVSANVIAIDAVEIDVLDATVVDDFLDQDTRLFGLFYQSLARILSERLRQTTLRGFG